MLYNMRVALQNISWKQNKALKVLGTPTLLWGTIAIILLLIDFITSVGEDGGGYVMVMENETDNIFYHLLDFIDAYLYYPAILLSYWTVLPALFLVFSRRKELDIVDKVVGVSVTVFILVNILPILLLGLS